MESDQSRRDFGLLWIGQAVSLVGSRATFVAVPLLILQQGGSPADAGIAAFAAAFPGIIFQLPAGVLVDRLDRRQVMLSAQLIRLLALTCLAIAVLRGFASLAIVSCSLAANAAAAAFFQLAERAAIPAVVGESWVRPAYARNEVRTRVATLIGPAAGGLLFQGAAFAPFAFDAGTYALSLLAVTLVETDLRVARPAQHHLLTEFRDGLRWYRHAHFYRHAVYVQAGTSFVGTAFPLALTLLLVSEGERPTQIGLVMAALGVGGMLGAFAASSLRFSVPLTSTFLGARWGIATCLALLALTQRGWEAALMLAPISVCIVLSNVAIGAARISDTSLDLRGRVESVGVFAESAVAPLGTLAIGYVVASVGARTGLAALAALMLAVAACGTADRRLRAGPPVLSRASLQDVSAP